MLPPSRLGRYDNPFTELVRGNGSDLPLLRLSDRANKLQQEVGTSSHIQPLRLARDLHKSILKPSYQAIRNFNTRYPPLKDLNKLPPELQMPDISGSLKNGYYLVYGFSVTVKQLRNCVKGLGLKVNDDPYEEWYEVYEYLKQTQFFSPDMSLCCLQSTDPGAIVFALYANGETYRDTCEDLYDEDKERQIIRLLADTLSPYTGQTEPLWYWASEHFPSFSASPAYEPKQWKLLITLVDWEKYD
ncbi:hypothetical protein GY45DRAFT_1339738 [Cubamyces sp. BRFM 1775]|nr:hypothetical protein GY45DRAFT_1339738 [Cubamyces sp. BRFM 1775]